MGELTGMEFVRAVMPYVITACLGGVLVLVWVFPVLVPPLAALAAFLGYSHSKKCVPARLSFKSTPFNMDLVDSCPILSEPFRPTPYLFNGHLHTLFASVLAPRIELRLHREFVRTYDGSEIALDWAGEGRPTAARGADGTPVVLILHGHTGGSESPYVRRIMQRVSAKGWRAVAYVFRGWSETGLGKGGPGYAGDSADLAVVLEAIYAACPRSPVLAVGYSLGANTIVKYLGEMGCDTGHLVGAVSISNPWDVLAVHRGLQRIYDQAVLLDLKKYLARHRDTLKTLEHLDLEHIESSQSVYEFDERLTCRLYGFQVDDYYAFSSSAVYVHGVRVPVVAVQAADDPMVSMDCIPFAACRHNENVVLVVTPTGGHLGFAEGWTPNDGPAWIDRLVEQVGAFMFSGDLYGVLRKSHAPHVPVSFVEDERIRTAAHPAPSHSRRTPARQGLQPRGREPGAGSGISPSAKPARSASRRSRSKSNQPRK